MLHYIWLGPCCSGADSAAVHVLFHVECRRRLNYPGRKAKSERLKNVRRLHISTPYSLRSSCWFLPKQWVFFEAVNFRFAAISHDIYARSLQGVATSSSTRFKEMRDVYSLVPENSRRVQHLPAIYIYGAGHMRSTASTTRWVTAFATCSGAASSTTTLSTPPKRRTSLAYPRLQCAKVQEMRVKTAMLGGGPSASALSTGRG
jgi:hypothetical protein